MLSPCYAAWPFHFLIEICANVAIFMFSPAAIELPPQRHKRRLMLLLMRFCHAYVACCLILLLLMPPATLPR